MAPCGFHGYIKSYSLVMASVHLSNQKYIFEQNIDGQFQELANASYTVSYPSIIMQMHESLDRYTRILQMDGSLERYTRLLYMEESLDRYTRILQMDGSLERYTRLLQKEESLDRYTRILQMDGSLDR